MVAGIEHDVGNDVKKDGHHLSPICTGHKRQPGTEGLPIGETIV